MLIPQPHYLLCIVCCILSADISAQFFKLPVNDYPVNGAYETKRAGDQDFVTLISGELYHIDFDSTLQLRLKRIDNSAISQTDFEMHDINQDGFRDIISYQHATGSFQVYVKQDHRFIYSTAYTITSAPPHTLHSQDFNGDMIEDLLINNEFFYTTGINQRERFFYNPAGATAKKTYVRGFDYQNDSDLDVIYHQSTTLYVLVNQGTEISNTNHLLMKDNDKVRWARLISTSDGPRLFYTHETTHQLRQTIMEPDTVYFNDMVTPAINATHEQVHVSDTDGDGTEEIILYSTNPSKLSVLRYDVVLDSFWIKETPMDNPGFAITGVFSQNGSTYFFILGNATTRLYRVEPDDTMILIYEFPSVMTHRENWVLDLDGDGYTDIFDDTHIKRYVGEGLFENPKPISFPPGTESFADLDGDGDMDIDKDSTWHENLDGVSFGPERPTPDPTPPHMLEGFVSIFRRDIDLDGDSDILAYWIFEHELQLFINHENVSLSAPVLLAGPSILAGAAEFLHLTDVAGDGTPDIVLGTRSGVYLIRQLGSHVFGSMEVLYDGPNIPLQSDEEDFNGDGKADIVLGTRNIIGGVQLGSIILYTGSEAALQPVLVHEGEGYHECYFADIDQTGWVDLVVKHGEGIFWASTSDGQAFQWYPIDSPPSEYFSDFSSIHVGDADHDGDIDIIWSLDDYSDATYYLHGVPGGEYTTCPEGDIYIRNQKQADRYRLRYPGCTVIPGTFYIGHLLDWSDITDMSMFAGIREIQGDFSFILHNQTDDFTGFSSLERIGGSFTIKGYKSKYLTGLEKLRYVGQDLYFFNITPVLTKVDLAELVSLDTIGRHLHLEGCSITNIRNLIQPVFKGDVRLTNLPDLQDEQTMSIIDTIYGELEINTSAVRSIDSLSEMHHLGSLRIHNSGLREFGAFRHIKAIPGDIILSQNPLLDLHSGFDSLTYIGGTLKVEADTCSIFHHLDHIGGDLDLSIGTFTGPSFQDVDSIGGYFRLASCGLQDMKMFAGLTYIGEDVRLLLNSKLTSFEGFEDFKGPVSGLSVSGHAALTSLNFLHDSLDVLGEWRLQNNPKLVGCQAPVLCRHLQLGRPVVISNNGLDCEDISRIRCLNNSFSGHVFYDFNQNLVHDPKEALLPNIRLVYEHSGDTVMTSTNGFYRTYAQEGDDIEVRILTPDDWIVIGDNSMGTDSFLPSDPFNYGNDFGLYPDFEKHDIQLTCSDGLFLCSRPYTMYFTLLNHGTYAEALALDIHYPEHVKLADTFSGYTTHDLENRILRFEFDTLFPFFSVPVSVPFLAPEAVQVGNVFKFEFDVWGLQDNTQVLLERQVRENLLLCSYDPNDKLVATSNGTPDIHWLSEDTLVYTIRFQNTGNYFAEHVRIIDTLSSLLDVKSLRFLASSHPVEIEINGQIIHFNFYDIFLPDSSANFEGSQGYVTFQIRPFRYDTPGDLLRNKADILFDYNPAIRTNEVISEVVDITGTAVAPDHMPYKLFPVPADQQLFVIPEKGFAMPNSKFEIFSLEGIRLQSGVLDASAIRVSGLADGMYYIKIFNTEYGVSIHPFVKSHQPR